MPRLPAIAVVVGAALGLGLSACGQADEGAENAAARADAKAAGPIATAITPAPAAQTAAADFAGKAAAGDAFELQAAQLAQQRASHAAVKDFAAMMLRDHGKSQTDLKQAMAQSGQALTAPGALSPGQQQGLADLAKLPPQDFDKAYMAGQVQAHEDALTLMQDYAQNGDNPALKAFAAQTAPVVQTHYEAAKNLRDELS
jgi:putative membrane protein